MPFENLPYVNFHELNADWMIEQLGNLNQYTERAEEYAEEAQTSAAAAALSVTAAQEQAQAAADQAQAAGDSAQAAADSAASISDVVEDLEAAISTVTGQLANKYKGKNLRAFGDSNMVTDYITPKIYNLVRDALEMSNAYSYAGNGDSFIQYSDEQTIISQLTTAPDDDDTALVICVGGINDLHYAAYSVPDFRTALNAFIATAKTKYPNADIVMAFDTGKQMPNVMELDYERAFMEECTGFTNAGRVIAVPTADMCQNPDLFYNQNHWNADGIKTIVSRITTMLIGGVPALCKGKRASADYTSDDPTPYGIYNVGYRVVTEIDPYACVRHDHIDCYFGSNIGSNNSGSAVGWIMRIPACYQHNDSVLNNALYRTVNGFQVKGGSTGQSGINLLAFEYNAYNLNAQTGDPMIILKCKYDQTTDYFAGFNNILHFDTVTGSSV